MHIHELFPLKFPIITIIWGVPYRTVHWYRWPSKADNYGAVFSYRMKRHVTLLFHSKPYVYPKPNFHCGNRFDDYVTLAIYALFYMLRVQCIYMMYMYAMNGEHDIEQPLKMTHASSHRLKLYVIHTTRGYIPAHIQYLRLIQH